MAQRCHKCICAGIMIAELFYCSKDDCSFTYSALLWLSWQLGFWCLWENIMVFEVSLKIFSRTSWLWRNKGLLTITLVLIEHLHLLVWVNLLAIASGITVTFTITTLLLLTFCMASGCFSFCNYKRMMLMWRAYFTQFYNVHQFSPFFSLAFSDAFAL